MPDTDPIHIILIHGTFARRADWIREEAPIRRYLGEALGDRAASTTITAFDWSGRNSLKARTAATQKLQAKIHAIVAADERTRLYIVAHSHGGNIALQAVADHERSRVTSTAWSASRHR
jgi:pimeloyl-ACP methyl ester carboxylesterase